MICHCENCKWFSDHPIAVECEMQDRLSNDQYDDFCDKMAVHDCPFMADRNYGLEEDINMTDRCKANYYFIDSNVDPVMIYGDGYPVCLSRKEVERLSAECGVNLFDVMHPASALEINEYGVYE